MRKEKERDIQKSIIDYLSLRKIFCYKQNTTGIYRKSTDSYIPNPSRGAPDIVCCVNGRFIGIEVKNKTGKLSEYQQEFQKKIEYNGGKYIVARSVDDVADSLEVKGCGAR